MDKHNCPICKVKLKFIERYPNYVCADCAKKAVDVNGRKLGFGNVSFSGGFEVLYLDTEEVYNSHVCYIEGVECYADEARFGGIVIEKQES